jgi:hypothetical protein
MIIAAMATGHFTIPAAVPTAYASSLPPAMRFFTPLLSPAGCDAIDVVAMCATTAALPRQIKHSRRPTVVLVGDDPGTMDGIGGPDAWRCTSKLARWVHGVLIHAAGGEPEHYAEAVRMARAMGRVAFIETTSLHAPAWTARLGCKRTLLILPRDGAHPCRPREVAQ